VSSLQFFGRISFNHVIVMNFCGEPKRHLITPIPATVLEYIINRGLRVAGSGISLPGQLDGLTFAIVDTLLRSYYEYCKAVSIIYCVE